MADERDAPEEALEQVEDAVDADEETPSPPAISGLDQEKFETPSGRYLGLFGVVGAIVGLAIGIQQGSAAFGMAVGLAIGVGIGLLLNTYTGK